MKKYKIILVILLIACISLIVLLFLKKDDSLIFNNNSIDIEIKKGERKKIDYVLNKELNITWSSDNPEVAVCYNGEVIGNSIGTTIITGKIKYNNEDRVIKSVVSVYEGVKGVNLTTISLPTNEMIMKVGTEYLLPINYIPKDSYISSISYIIDNNIVSISNNKIKALGTGECNVQIIVNNNIKENIHVLITNDNVNNGFIKSLKNVIINKDNYELEVGSEEIIKYQIEPSDAYIYNTKWEIENEKIASVSNNGKITALSDGETIISLTINDKFINKMKVKVVTSMSDIQINSKTSIDMRINDTSQILTSIIPNNAWNKKIIYKSNNDSVTVSETGLIRAVKSGKSVITISSLDGKINKIINVNVLPRVGVISGDGIWGYLDNKTVVPLRADINFFTSLAKNGIGTISNNIYTYSKYSYDLDNSVLSGNGLTALVRIYYPPSTDLSLLNTFTFIGGKGELNWRNYFSAINNDPSNIKTGGIIILISGKTKYSANEARLGTDFVKEIVKQKSGRKNAIGGYSLGGPAAGDAFAMGGYDSLFIFNSYFSKVSEKDIKNKEIYVYSPKRDSMIETTRTMLNAMIINNYSNVTIVTNNNDLINAYKEKMLIVNPDSLQGSGHGYINITNSNVFAFACRD